MATTTHRRRAAPPASPYEGLTRQQILDICEAIDGPGGEWLNEAAGEVLRHQDRPMLAVAPAPAPALERCHGCSYLTTWCSCPGGVRWAA